MGSRSRSSLLETKLTSRRTDFTREEHIASNVDRYSVVRVTPILYHIFIWAVIVRKCLDYNRVVHILVLASIGWSVKARLSIFVGCVRVFITYYGVFFFLSIFLYRGRIGRYASEKDNYLDHQIFWKGSIWLIGSRTNLCTVSNWLLYFCLAKYEDFFFFFFEEYENELYCFYIVSF